MKTPEILWKEIEAKLASNDSTSGTVALLNQGVHAIGKKLLEEAGESWMAAEYQSKDDLALELSQLLYYILVIAKAKDISLEDIYKKL